MTNGINSAAFGIRLTALAEYLGPPHIFGIAPFRVCVEKIICLVHKRKEKGKHELSFRTNDEVRSKCHFTYQFVNWIFGPLTLGPYLTQPNMWNQQSAKK